MKVILEKIKEYDTIILHGHIRPDGDSIGTQYGLKYLIENSFPNKKVYISGESSDKLSFIGVPNFVDESLFKNALSICVDSALADRLSDNRYYLSDYSIKIDHHIKDKEYCDYEYIDTTVSSTAQIIVEFYLNFKDELIMNNKAAEALYVGILTDSGYFNSANVTYNTFLCVTELVKYNIDLQYINQMVSLESMNLLKLKGYCLENFQLTEYGFAYIKITKELVKQFNVTAGEAASLVNVFSTLKEVVVWALFLETDKEIRVRLRSKGPDVNLFANKYNGGGHKLASGAKLNNWDELDKFILDMKEYLN